MNQQSLIIKASVLLAFLLSCVFYAEAQRGEPAWVKQVGSKTKPSGTKTFYVNEFGAKSDGLSLSTKAIQSAIDNCAEKGGGVVCFEKGKYLTGSLFVKKNVTLLIDSGVLIMGSQNLLDYPDIDTRVAGIEMIWPAALINVLDQDNVKICGKGIVDAQGSPFWENYAKMRREYTPKDLRWVVDYDCKRPRTMLVSRSSNVTLQGLTLQRAGFWTVQVLYSSDVTVDGLIIRNNIGGHGPSTDGVDIDSSTRVLVENCDIDCNDDNFCLKAGRDADGLRVNRPCEYVVIRNCVAGAGGGLITCGSETSGSIRNIWVENLSAKGTQVGFRVKSALTRGGVVENIFLNNIVMQDVAVPIEVTTNWNPSYSYSTLPEGYNYDSVPDHWRKLVDKVVPASAGIPVFRKIYVNNLKAVGARRALSVSGMKESVIDGFYFNNVRIEARSAGNIKFSRNWIFNNVEIIAPDTLIISDCSDIKL